MKKTYCFIIVTALFLLVGCKENNKKEYTKLQGKIFGTTYHIIYKSKNRYQKKIDSLFANVNKSLSTYLPTSDISRINNNDSTVVVDDLFVEVFMKSKKIYKETDGYFDPTLGQLVNAYGFGAKKGKKEITKEDVNRLMKLVGFDKVQLKDRKISKQIPEIQFDVNAIAKGFGIDVIARYLESEKIVDYLIEIGGEIRTKGLKNGKPWKIAIEKPHYDGTRSVQKIINLTDRAMATSGNYRKYKLTKNGKKYVHIINPHTGLAQESNLLSASVIANTDCADVDAYATAFMTMGLTKTKAFLEKKPNIKVVLLYVDNDQKIKEYTNLYHLPL